MWMAPEIIMGKTYTEKADVYAFGEFRWLHRRVLDYKENRVTQLHSEEPTCTRSHFLIVHRIVFVVLLYSVLRIDGHNVL